MRASYFFVLAFLILAMPAGAQVSVNLDALNPPAAGQATPRATRPATRPAASARPATRPRPAATGTAARRPGTTTTQAPATAAPAASTSTGAAPAAGTAAIVGVGAAALALPAAAPETPVIPPPALPASALAPPPPVQRPATSATAGSTTAATTDGLRVIFASGKSDLTPESATALTDFAKKVPAGENISLNVVAFSAGTPEDPSTARRLSLARALAIRTALMADGIASTRIYVRAMGVPAGTDTGPLDRVDIAVLGASNPQPGSQASPPTAARP